MVFPGNELSPLGGSSAGKEWLFGEMISHSLFVAYDLAFKKVLHKSCVISSNKNWQSLTVNFRGLVGWIDPALSHSIKKSARVTGAHRIEEGGLLDVKMNLHDINAINNLQHSDSKIGTLYRGQGKSMQTFFSRCGNALLATVVVSLKALYTDLIKCIYSFVPGL